MAATLRLAIGQQKDKFEWQIEGAFPVLINLPTDAIAPAPQGQLGLGANYFAANGRQDGSAFIKQAFFRFKGLGGDKASSLRLGRFEFNDGTETTPADASLAAIKRDHISQRLIGTFGFTHVGCSFDGLHFSRTSKLGNLTFVGARPTEGVFQLRGWNDGTHGTFFQVLPTPRIYARTPFYNLMNNEDTLIQLRLKQHAQLALRTDVHHLRLSSRRDLWYVGGGAFQQQTFGYVGRPSNSKKTLGTMVDLSVDYNVTSRTAVTFHIAGVRGGGITASIYPDGRNARFAYIEVSQRF